MTGKSVINFLVLSMFLISLIPLDGLAQSKTAIPFDSNVTPFSETPAGKDYIKKNGPPPIRDAWGYPPKQNIYKTLKKPKTTFLQKVFNLLLIDSAYAYDYIDQVNLPGAVNCRSNSLQASGYFKAYFEDKALHNGLGYDDQTNGDARILAVCTVLQEIAGIIKLNTTGVTPDILFAAYSPADDTGGALASASPYYGDMIGRDGTLHQHITKRVDPTPNDGDFDALVNTYYGHPYTIDLPAVPYSFDFQTVMRHELFHALGFNSSIPWIVTNTGISVAHNTFAEFLYNTNNTTQANRFFSFLQSAFNPVIQVPVGSPSNWYGTNDVFYKGLKNIVGATPDAARPIYSPSSVSPGSSLSHFDMNRLPAGDTSDYVMHPGLAPDSIKYYHTHEKEVLCHLGYEVVGLCEGPTPVARDDFVPITGATQCVSVLPNDTSFTGGIGSTANLSLHDVEILNLPSSASISYDYTGTNCSNAVWGQGAFGAKSVLIQYNSGLQSVSFKYRVKDSVSQRISQPAFVNLTNCNVTTDEYICNGDFELGPKVGTNIGPYANMAYLSDVPFWGTAGGTPDLVYKNRSGFAFSHWNLPFTMPNGLALDMLGASNYAAFVASSPENPEKITTKLKAPLGLLYTYRLSFDILLNGFDPATTSKAVLASLTTSNTFLSNGMTFPVVPNGVTVLNQSIPISFSGQGVWTHVSVDFQPTQAFEYLVVHLPDTLPGVESLIDNVSIKKITTNNSISGKVYNDLNLNGIDASDGTVPSVTIGLFNSPTATSPILTTTTNNFGNYTFASLSSSPTSSFYVAIVPESGFAQITVPATSSVLSGFQHARQVQMPGGAVVGQDFAVRLNNQTLPLAVSRTIQRGCTTATSNSISLTVTGGLPPYTYEWTGPTGPLTGGVTLSSIGPGNYSVIVRDANLNTASTTATLLAVATTNTTLTATPIPALTGTGSVSNTTTGSAPFTYYWTGPNGFASTQSALSGLTSPGTYTLNATNSYGCISQKSVLVKKLIQATATIQRGCSASDSSISISAQGGLPQPDYTYVWSGPTGVMSGQSGSTATGLSSGNYTVTIGDSLQTTTTVGVTIGAFVPTVVNGSITYPTSANNNGAVNVTASGAGPLTYLWSNGAQTEDLSALAAGTYTVTVKNIYQCLTQKTFVVSPKIQVTLNKSEGCGPTSNSVTSTVTGGNPGGYTYLWSKVGGGYSFDGPNPSGITPGTYSVVVSDVVNGVAGQSSSPVSITINPYQMMNVTTLVTNATAPNYTNGSIKATLTGGVGPFTYYWTGNGGAVVGPTTATTNTRSNLTGNAGYDPAYSYGVFVKDARNCTSNTTPGQKILRKLTVTTSTVASCLLTTTPLPMIIVSAVGGHTPLTYSWKKDGVSLSNNVNSAALTGSGPGIYTVTVTDAANQVLEAPAVELTSATPALHTILTQVTNATGTSNNGSVKVTVAGGNAPYTYSYSTGASYPGITAVTHTKGSLAPGSYTASVKTNYGCSASQSFTVLRALLTPMPK